MKPLTDQQYAFKAAVRRAVKLCGGPTAAAEIVRVDAARLSRYGNPDCPEFAPIDVCFELDRAAGDNVILRSWADMCGLDVTPRKIDERITADLVAAAGASALDAGELVSVVIEAASDGDLTNNEGRAILERASDSKASITRIEEFTRRSMASRS